MESALMQVAALVAFFVFLYYLGLSTNGQPPRES